MFDSINIAMVQAIIPEISLLVLAAILLAYDLLTKTDKQKEALAWITFAGFVITIVLAVLFAMPVDAPELLWGGMLSHDLTAFIFKLVFLGGASLVALLSIGWEKVGRRGEFYILLTVATFGMNLMAAASDLIMLFLAIETTSIPLYILSGFMTGEKKSVEAGFKYLLFGAMTTAIMLYGFSLLFGFTGTTDLTMIAEKFTTDAFPAALKVGVMVLITAGFGFKVSMFPMQFWAPDVYEGAPTPVTAYLSTASKVAGFAVMLRFLLLVFPPAGAVSEWMIFIAIAAVFTMTLGNTIALAQRNIKRLLAYSSIAHAGNILLGIAAASELGTQAILYYAAAYTVTNIAAFAVVIIFYQSVGSDNIVDYSGLSRRSPYLALAMLVAFLSLAGIPPLGGFIGKVLVFASAVEAGFIWLAVIAVLNAIISLYYYLNVMKYVYLYKPLEEDAKPVKVSRVQGVVLAVCVIGIILLGTVISPLLNWAEQASAALF